VITLKNVLIIGSGGREQALTLKLQQSEPVGKVYCLPGNGGTATMPYVENISGLAVTDFDGILKIVDKYDISLTVVGPEDPLANGIVDRFNEKQKFCFGPTKAAAQLESSKIFAKKLMHELDIPCARDYFVENAEGLTQELKDKIKEFVGLYGGVVIKDDALAAGKGVTVCKVDEWPKLGQQRATLKAFKALEDILVKEHNAVIEEPLFGEEFSYIGVTDGTSFIPFLSSQDHKPVNDGDKGPNTGGMGAYAPAPIVTYNTNVKVGGIAHRIIDEMKAKHIPYTGALYLGCMMTKEGPKVLEVNCRFGDPETQAILSLFKGDLYSMLHACTTRQLDKVEDKFTWNQGAACCVVLASKGYPGEYGRGFPISGLDLIAEVQNVNVFHAGTKYEGKQVVTSGGRVLGVTGIGKDIHNAISTAYSAIDHISFEGMHYRKDIGQKALKHKG
jgi:phosphoribosylamine--glycine ligase